MIKSWRDGSLIQDLVGEFYANRVLRIQPLDDIDQLCDDAADLVVFLVVIPILYVVSPDHLPKALFSHPLLCCIPRQASQRVVQIRCSNIRKRGNTPAARADCAHSSTAENRLFSATFSHGILAASSLKIMRSTAMTDVAVQSYKSTLIQPRCCAPQHTFKFQAKASLTFGS